MRTSLPATRRGNVSTTIFIDECGYTGDDLFASDQPVFVIATHSFSEDEATALKRQFFAEVAMSELKHSALQRRARHWPQIVQFLRHLVEQPGTVRVALAHKRFALTCKLVDFVIEPSAHRDGLDLYENGNNIALANLLHFGLSAGGSQVLAQVLRLFQRLIRQRSDESAREFVRFLGHRQPVSVIDETLDHIRAGLVGLEQSDILTLPTRALDISLTAALSCVYPWRQSGVTPTILVHDASTNMARQRELWAAILAPDAPAALVGYGDVSVQFPIGVESTSFKDSRHSDALQVADVIAGAVARWSRWIAGGRAKSDGYGVALDGVLGTGAEALFAWFVWPSHQIEARPPAPPSVEDPLEYLAERAADVSSPSNKSG